MTLYEELKARGLVAQITDDEIIDLINNGKATFYIGFDCTADSLTAGHFMALTLMKRLQMAGNKPIALIGGGTTMIGDPSGRTDMRKMLTKEDIAHNAACFKKQMEKFIDFSDGMTRKYAKVLEGTNTRVLDTRKTTPGMRILEKMAVKIGGGVNHRIGLFDMILLKDNHVDFAGGIDKAITRAKEYCKEKGKDLKIEIEVRSFDELQQVLDLGGVDRIMFDNFTPEMTKKAVEMVAGKYETESSGGITFDTLRDYAECGVDFISVGALTHSVKGLDMSFKAC